MANIKGKYKLKDIYNNYDVVHLETEASQVIDSSDRRFVSDAKITEWNQKETPSGAQIKATQALNNAKAYSETFTQNYAEPKISSKKTAFNKDFGTVANTIAVGNHGHTAVDGSYKMLGKDTRLTNETPQWYMTNHSKSVMYEFKATTTVGLTSINGYVEVSTYVPWKDPSGGLPVQIATSNLGIFQRLSLDSLNWGPWKKFATTDIATTAISGLMSNIDKVKLDGIQAGANNYVHPTTHDAAIINESATRRFVSDADKTTWNNKADRGHIHIGDDISDATWNNTASMIVKRNASGDFSARNITANLIGNASTASSSTKLTTPRKINGVNFDGTADIVISADANSHNHTSDQITDATSSNIANKIVKRDSTGLIDISSLNLGANEIRQGGGNNNALVFSANGSDVYLRPNKSDTSKQFIVSSTFMTFNGNKVYHAGEKPTLGDIGAAPASHGHDRISNTFVSTPFYNIDTGILIDIGPAAVNTMASIRIKGNGYAKGILEATYSFYDHDTNSGIINAKGITSGIPFNLSVFIHNGRLKVWTKQPGSFQTLIFEITLGLGIVAPPIYTTEVKPTAGITNEVTIVPARVYSDIYKQAVSWNEVSGKPTFALVATSGNYNDLAGKPTLALVATSGSYNDLTGKPTIHTINDATNTSTTNTWSTKKISDSLALKANSSHTHAHTQITGLGSAATYTAGTAANNLPILDSRGKLSTSVMPSIALNDTFTATSQADAMTKTVENGDIVIISESGVTKTYICVNAASTTFDNKFKVLQSGTDTVSKSEFDTELYKKVDKVGGKQLSTNDYSTVEKNKLAGIADKANNYVHPSKHNPGEISTDSNNRFVTDTEKNTWKSKADGNHNHDATYANINHDHDTKYFRRDMANSVDVRLSSGDFRGLKFWDSDNYKIYMASSSFATEGGRLDTLSDYNMYFKMAGGSSRGFVFKNEARTIAHLDGLGVLRTTGDVFVNSNKVYHAGNKPTLGDIGAAPSSHNHTSLTGITSLSFSTDISDSASIRTVISGSQTYFDFNLGDDPTQDDMWRWRFTPAGGTVFNAMTLDPTSSQNANLVVAGELYSGPNRVYHAGNKPTLGDIGAAPSSHNHNAFNAKDIRDTIPTPDSLANKEVTAFFSNEADTGGMWKSGISVAGWTAGYQVWQLFAGSTTKDSEDLCFRAGRGATWRPMRRIYHEGFKPTPSDIGASEDNHGHSNYLALSGGMVTGKTIFNTNTNSTPLVVSRLGSEAEAMLMTVDDQTSKITCNNDEAASIFEILVNNTDTEAPATGVEANTNSFKIIGNKTDPHITFNNKRIYHQGYNPTPTDIGAASSSHIHDYSGIDGSTYIAFAKDGRWRQNQSNFTGYLKITLPQSWTSTMLQFTVDIYNYAENTSASYTVGGYNYKADGGTWSHASSAYCLAHRTSRLGNLPVRFGHDGTKCAIYIGDVDTAWNYPQVTIKDISVGFGSYELSKWNVGWGTEVTTTLGTITATVTETSVKSHTHQTLSRGSYLTGSNYNGDGATTWDVDATEAATGSKIVARDDSGDINARLLKSNYQDQSTISGGIAYRVNNSSDRYVRFCNDMSAVRNFVSVYSKAETYTKNEEDTRFRQKTDMVFTDSISITTPAT